MKPVEESPEEEAKETPAKEAKEVNSGAEGIIPEEFQTRVLALISECDDKQCLSFMRDAIYRKEEDMRKAEMNKKSKGKGKVPDEYSMAESPSY